MEKIGSWNDDLQLLTITLIDNVPVYSGMSTEFFIETDQGYIFFTRFECGFHIFSTRFECSFTSSPLVSSVVFIGYYLSYAMYQSDPSLYLYIPHAGISKQPFKFSSR